MAVAGHFSPSKSPLCGGINLFIQIPDGANVKDHALLGNALLLSTFSRILVDIFDKSICKFVLQEVREDIFVLQNQNQIQLSNVQYLSIQKKNFANSILFYLTPKKNKLFRTLTLELFNIS